MSDFRFESSSHFVNCVIKIATQNGYKAYHLKLDLTLVYNKYETNLNKLNAFTADVKFATNKQKDLVELIESYMNGIRKEQGAANTEYIKLFYTTEQKKHFEKLLNKSGVYRLHDENGDIRYIGKSINLGSRILGSINERKLNRYSYIIIDNHADASLYEIYYIAKYKPDLNKESNTNHKLTVELPEHTFTDIEMLSS